MPQIHGGIVNSSSQTQQDKYFVKRSGRASILAANYNKITNSTELTLNNKHREKYRVPITLQDGHAANSEDNDHSTSFKDIVLKNLNAFSRFCYPYSMIGVIVETTAAGLLPVQSIADLTPTFFMGLFKALVPTILIQIYGLGINQLNDVEIDKVNKPYLPLASGEISIGAGKAITFGSLAVSLAMGIMYQSPPLLLGLVTNFLLQTFYSADLPLLRWKKNPFATIAYLQAGMLLYLIPYFLHSQTYLLGRPVAFTKSIMFATAFKFFYGIILALFKDIPDIEGDNKFGIQSFATKIGPKRIFWLGVQLLLIAYGAAVVVGASSSFLLHRLVIIFGHCALASWLYLRAQSADISSKASMSSFYMLIWKLSFAEQLLFLFIR